MAPRLTSDPPPVINRLRGLTWEDLAGVGAAATELCRVAKGLRSGSFLKLLDRLQLRQDAPRADAQRVERATRWVRWAHRIVPLEENCLLDCLAAASLVRRQGFSVPLAIGVRMTNSEFEAHAWLGEENLSRATPFKVLYRVPETLSPDPLHADSESPR